MKKIVYLDMDNVLVDFPSGIAQLDEQLCKNMQGVMMRWRGFLR